MTPQAPLRLASSSIDPALADLVEELTAKLQAGEVVDADAILRAHPEHAEQLRPLLPALAMLVGLSGSREENGPAPDGVAGTLGDFRILRDVGRGGMGVVYEAEQISLGRRVALKVLPFAAAMDSKRLQRFKNEAQAAAGLHYTNIVPVYGVGCERGVPYYAMQFIDGQTLAAVIHELRLGERGCVSAPSLGALTQPRSPEEIPTGPFVPTTPAAALSTERSTKSPAFFRTVANLGVQAAEALEHAHLMSVIHRDVKPANLLVDGRGNLWVTDFGLAQAQSDTRLTLTGDLVQVR
jgi:eukaryotic-like serine/threonine-protein kinase